MNLVEIGILIMAIALIMRIVIRYFLLRDLRKASSSANETKRVRKKYRSWASVCVALTFTGTVMAICALVFS